MKNKEDYIRDLAEVRSMMERSTRFLSLSGLSGVLAGFYALVGSIIAWRVLEFDPQAVFDSTTGVLGIPTALLPTVVLACLVLFFAAGTATLLSQRKARKNKERLWNPVTKSMISTLLTPLIAGGLLILIYLSRGMVEIMAPFTLIFYGIALYNSGKFTYREIKSLGLIQLTLGVLAAWQPAYGLLFWALGFGLAHIIYGIYMHYRYDR